jgi:GTPase
MEKDQASNRDHSPEPFNEPEVLPTDHRSGFVAVLGRPNVGKSTLLNALLGQKIAIVSPKPQTTRNRLLGIFTSPKTQIVFIDTPGIHQPKHKFGEFMVNTALSSILDADVILWLVDASSAPNEEDMTVAQSLRQNQTGKTVIMALNKTDLVNKQESADREHEYTQLFAPKAVVSISALRGDNQDKLLETIIAHLPLGPRYYPADEVTDLQTRFIVAELIREAALMNLKQEVPHALAVQVQEFKERNEKLTYISATLFVERDSQKAIVIGEKGRTLKLIGSQARTKVEGFLETKVFLELWVKVLKDWRKKEEKLKRLGYSLPS